MMTDFDKKLKYYDDFMYYKSLEKYSIIPISELDGRCCEDLWVEAMEESPGFIGQSAR